MTHPRICVAIRRQEPVDLMLEEGVVRFEPYEHGWLEAGGAADDAEAASVVYGYVVEGGEVGWEAGWRSVAVEAIEDVQPTGGEFLPRFGYDLDDPVLAEHHCRLVHHGMGW